MNYHQIRKTDISNGQGIRVSIFVQGCEFKCAGCFNSSASDFSLGNLFTDDTIKTILSLVSRKHIKGLSILGGEPLHDNNISDVIQLAKIIKKETNKNIWCYTGFIFEDIISQKSSEKYELLKYIDVLVDGPFIEDLKDLTLQFRGSSNQNIIDVQESLKQNKKILYNLETY